MGKIIKNRALLLILDIILIVICVISCKYIAEFEFQKSIFTNDLEKFVKENKKPVFKIGKIVLYSSANAKDNSGGDLSDINISQFTDIAIYIDNKNKDTKITAENTVKELYIDNIKTYLNSNMGECIVNYKNPKEFGKYSDLKKHADSKIFMNIITTNKEIGNVNYNNNIFYTDCSNPLSLGFINKDFIKNGKVSDTKGELLFDGSILKNASIDLKSISGKIQFVIHLKNNLGENFICNVSIENDLERNESEILNGYSIIIDETKNKNYSFLKVSED